jgi:hypothetical protein
MPGGNAGLLLPRSVPGPLAQAAMPPNSDDSGYAPGCSLAGPQHLTGARHTLHLLEPAGATQITLICTGTCGCLG